MVTLNNIELINFLKTELNQDGEVFKEEDLLNIEQLRIDSRNFADEYDSVEFEDLKYFGNLKVLSLSNLTITNRAMEIMRDLTKLEEVNFENCTFENLNELVNLRIEKLTLNNCEIDDNSFIYSMNYLKELNLISSYLNVSKLNKFYLLRSLNLASSIVTKVDNFDLPLLEELVIDFSNITNLSFLLNISTLKRLSVSREQIDNNKEIIKTLISNDVEVWENNIIRLGENL